MANDREILREIWNGRIPTCFNLNSEEVHDVQVPDPVYLMIPRLSYFPLVTDKIRKHFIRHIHPDKQNAEMWLDYNGQPLKWHYPIGVLYDLYASESSLPWNITVHFDKFPETELLHCPGREAVESHFMACVKEADVLKHRSQVVSNMQKKDHMQLWLGLQNVDASEWHKVPSKAGHRASRAISIPETESANPSQREKPKDQREQSKTKDIQVATMPPQKSSASEDVVEILASHEDLAIAKTLEAMDVEALPPESVTAEKPVGPTLPST
uniref:Autophagy associated protein n=1 Tax=Locusta migratoria TaxID=7004 RepID=A0A8A2HEZ2_LOCMI|nr:autophagy associated protein [Locusta migratoria]